MVMNNTTYAQLCANMEQLKLTQMLLHLDEITDFVTTNHLSFKSLFTLLLKQKNRTTKYASYFYNMLKLIL